jgi:hypothetical protein
VGKGHLLDQVAGGHVQINLGHIILVFWVWWHGLGHQATDLVIPKKLSLEVSGSRPSPHST